MRTERHTMRDLLDEAKKRIVLVLVCVVGLSYLMSLTSSSVWVNLPAAASLIIFFRYISLDLDVRRRSSSSNKPPSVSREKKPLELRNFSADKFTWRRKVDSPAVEAAIDQFTRHLISEWMTNLWYSRITPDKEGPEELIQIMNHVLGEVSFRAREINLINLLTRDIINLICSHLELYRLTQAKIGEVKLGTVFNDHRDAQIKLALVSENKLHPALVSTEAEHKVLQHLITGLISLTLKPEDLNCAFFRYTARELLACAVIRPLLNMANPRFVNEKVELLVTSTSKRADEIICAEDMPSIGPSRIPLEHSSGPPEGSDGGLELVQLKANNSSAHNQVLLHRHSNDDSTYSARDSSSIDVRSTGAHAHRSEWGAMLDIISTRKTRALAPEHFENMWTKGRDYNKKEDLNKDARASGKVGHSKVEVLKGHNENNGNLPSHPSDSLSQETLWRRVNHGDPEIDSEGSYQTDEDDDGNNITGLDSPVTMVWDSKNKKNSAVSHIRHPLENFEFNSTKRNSKSRGHHLRTSRSQSGRKRYRAIGQKISSRIDGERASFLSDDNGDMHVVDESETEISERFHSGAAASSSKSGDIINMEDSFLKLKCEVLGANIVKSGIGTFAVYSISVTDAASNSWSIKRRFRHFEDLHRRLKEFPEYSLHLPPKHFLSSGLEVSVIQERCKFLDKYLKMLLQIPTLSGSMEVWDFLSVDSQTYIFADSFSIIETLSVDLDYKPYENRERIQNVNLDSRRQESKSTSEGSSLPIQEKSESYRLRFKTKNNSKTLPQEENTTMKGENSMNPSQSTAGQRELSHSALEAVTDPTIPIEWIPPNLSMPILDLVDVVFQLQDGGWIRRQVFWIAKQVLQLGMGDAFDDWLIGKIQHLRRGSFVASAINRIEQILWPDGIFLTKHPNRRRPPADQNSLTDEQRQEAARRADFVHDLIIQKAPAALVGLIGRKEYEHCAEDVYYFLQSAVCLKQLAFDLLELLLLSVFPELDHVIRQIHEDKDPITEAHSNP